MSQIHVTNLTFRYDGSADNIFENVSFLIDTDWKLGFVGRNGRGKTTFLKLLTGQYEYRGTISTAVQFDYFPPAVPDEEQNTADVVDGIIRDYEPWQLKKELTMLEVKEDVLYRPFRTLSKGEQTKVLLAALFLQNNHFLLIDEPTNHLDTQARETVGKYLNAKKGFILVSHDRQFIDACIDHVLAINKLNIEVQKGNFSSWYYNKQLQDDFETAENEKLSKEVRHLTEAARQTARWSDAVEKTKKGTRNSGVKPDKGHIGHQAAKMMKRSKSIELRRLDAAEEKSMLLKNIETADELKIHPLEYHTSMLIQVEQLRVSYQNTAVCENVSFSINRGDRAVLCGKNGSGKSSILKLLTGEHKEYTGKVQIGSSLTISYVPQDTSFLQGDLRDYAKNEGIDESLFKAILRKLDFDRGQFEKNISVFSEGQKKKVLIAGSLCRRAHLYIWDEPLNYIDVISRMQIEELVMKFRPTMLLVEHDKAFIDKISTKQIQL